MKEEIKISESDLIENFPFKEIRSKQLEGMKQIAQDMAKLETNSMVLQIWRWP
jgi:hypothetical protein